MGIKKYQPTSPGRRGMTVSTFDEITTAKPEKSLLEPKKSKGGRNNQGRLTTRHQGGGHKQMYRKIDFKRTKDGVPAKVASIEYDPNRTANIALLNYADGEKAYILAPQGLKVGDSIISGETVDIITGNCLPLSAIPIGTVVHNVELRPAQGGQLGRSAGCAIQLMAKEGKYATLRMPSGEMRMVLAKCRATLGQVGNIDQANINIGKAGRSRWLGVRPANRGVVMNPVDHPHGGGEGRSPVGRNPVTPWGKPALGAKTRDPKKSRDRLIMKRRNSK